MVIAAMTAQPSFPPAGVRRVGSLSNSADESLIFEVQPDTNGGCLTLSARAIFYEHPDIHHARVGDDTVVCERSQIPPIKASGMNIFADAQYGRANGNIPYDLLFQFLGSRQVLPVDADRFGLGTAANEQGNAERTCRPQ